MAGGGFQYLVRRAEEDADTKDYERADHRPPGERDFGNRGGLLERPVDTKQGRHRVQDGDVQLPDDHSHEKAGGNSDHVSSVGPAPFGEHTDEEHTEHGAQNESGDSEYHGDDSQIRIRHLGTGESAGDDDHEHGEDDREPADSLD